MEQRKAASGKVPKDQPTPPADAYYSLVDALEAAEHDHRCLHMKTAVELVFMDPADRRRIRVLTTAPTCLTREMVRRGCLLVDIDVKPRAVEWPEGRGIEGFGW